MKVLQKVAFTLSSMAIAFSVLFTILHMEWVRELYIFAACAFFIGSLVEYRHLRNVIGLVCSVLLLAGLELKLMHLTGGNQMMMIGIALMAFAYIPVAIWKK